MDVATRCRGSVLTHNIPFKAPELLPQLVLPRLRNSTNNHFHPYTQYLNRHFNFRLASEPWLYSATDKLRRRCEAELNAIETAFPNLHSENIILAMSAWFSMLCTVDDLVEKLLPAVARTTLLESMKILREGYVFYDPGTVALPAPDGNVLLSPGPDNAERCNDVDTDADAAAQIRHFSCVFRTHVQALLPESTYWPFCTDICSTWTGIISETHFRSTSNSLGALSSGQSSVLVPPPARSRLDVSTYMSIRTRTIGLAPFMTLLESYALPENHVKSDALCALQENVCIVVGLQNDILGLERDLADGEALNFVVIAAGLSAVQTSSSPTTHEQLERLALAKDGVVKAVTWHNHAVEMARMHWRTVQAVADEKGWDGESEVADEMFNFIATHYHWASSTQRYRVSKEVQML